MLTRRWRGGPVWGTPAAFRLNGHRGPQPYQGRPFSRDLTGSRRAAGMHIRIPNRGRSNLLVAHAGLRGAGKNIRKWNSFLRWGSAPNPWWFPSVSAAGWWFWLVVFGWLAWLCLRCLAWFMVWFMIWLVLVSGWLVVWSNQYCPLDFSWPEF
jgi:hypothetical protein